MKVVIDAKDHILGRLASRVARLALEGNEVIILNAEKTVLSSPKKEEIFKEKHERGDPYHGPFYPRYPDQIVKRVIRGMLPYKKERGRKAFKRVKAYIGVPEELKGEYEKAIKLEDCTVDKLNKRAKFIYLEEVSKKLGAKW
jgi:large subunit ribosomal protein L13